MSVVMAAEHIDLKERVAPELMLPTPSRATAPWLDFCEKPELR